MITIKHIVGYSFAVNFDKPDIAAIRKLADAYVIPSDDMIVACINKGIDVIGKQIQDNKKQEQETCEGG